MRAARQLPAGMPQLPVHPAAGRRRLPGREPTDRRPSARSPGTSPEHEHTQT